MSLLDNRYCFLSDNINLKHPFLRVALLGLILFYFNNLEYLEKKGNYPRTLGVVTKHSEMRG